MKYWRARAEKVIPNWFYSLEPIIPSLHYSSIPIGAEPPRLSRGFIVTLDVQNELVPRFRWY